MHVLIVKTSSLGDLVHTLPALTDARRARPDLRFDWLAEKAFAEIPTWHPAIERVVPCELRRWRRNFLASLRDGSWRAFRARLAERRYDLVLDAQGLVKSAWLATRATGPRAGFDRASAREPLASLLYERRYAVARGQHAVERVRALFAAALGYPRPDGPPDFGIDRGRLPAARRARPYVVFLHATTWPTKCWAEASWIELGHWLRGRGLDVLLPWGSAAEHAVAQRLGAAFGGEVLPRLSLTDVAGVLAHAGAVVGVDTGLAHVAAAVGTPSVTLYGPTLPGLTGTVGDGQVHLCSSTASEVDRARPTTVPVAAVQAALQPLLGL